MLEAMLGGLGLLFDYRVLIMVVIGIVYSQFIAVIPGLGGPFMLALIVPFAVVQDLVPGLALLVATTTATGTGNTVSSIYFAVPGSGGGVASIFDGHPMARRGEGQRALSAGLTASMVGGIFGAMAMVVIIPAVRPIVLSLGPPEFFALTLVAIVFIGYVGEASFSRSLLSGGIGMLLGLMGLEPATSATRYTMGSYYLWDGLPLVPMLLGLFAFAEMMALMRRGGRLIPTAKPPAPGERSQLKQGIRDVFAHWPATLRSSMVGMGVGLLPGLGMAASQFIAYGSVAKAMKGKTEYEFGKGAIEGVIAADAATNAKDGGGFIPTLAFGIPGSSSMAILLGAMVMLGIQPGRSMMEGDGLSIVWLIIFILVLSSVLSTGLVMALMRPLTKLASTRGSILAPIILCVSLFGAYATRLNIRDIFVLFIFGALGYFMKKHDYSRATLVIGFVLAPLAERGLMLSYNIHGWGFLQRPLVQLILITTVLSLTFPILRQRFGRGRSGPSEAAARAPENEDSAPRG
ncbi:tripartite tricarboxylate transporter permease [Egicoccus halophilus]|uniref:Membrane protein n=1 Tax=Egicoccus halophilus TaxID=1670830 RepID=A0A8J3A9A5_9ACTN|nr:tripartite tricarboxylate transporter permease [Egicoccus halophilus]GGI07526.1 membrane protein [Egicoccus halophilus]